MAFKMKGVPYPVNRKGKINPNSEGNTDLKDGRSASAAFQYSSPAKQSNKDLKDYLIDEKGFNQSDADKMIEDGAYTVSDKGFLSWYKTKDEPAPDVDTPAKIYKKKKGSHSKY
tara:strand:+ start:1572 stop:1913 length:342 start_codon:yes stop_codon:yes gene_type:complete